MKVLHKGKRPVEQHEFKGTCAVCGFSALFKRSELTCVEDRGQDQYTFTCPTSGCRSTIWCTENPWLKGVLEDARKSHGENLQRHGLAPSGKLRKPR